MQNANCPNDGANGGRSFGLGRNIELIDFSDDSNEKSSACEGIVWIFGYTGAIVIANRQLAHGQALAAHGHFGRAAEALGITQPGLTP